MRKLRYLSQASKEKEACNLKYVSQASKEKEVRNLGNMPHTLYMSHSVPCHPLLPLLNFN